MIEKTEEINKDLILREKLALQRTMMANQTTFLSFTRTSLYFLVAGLSVRPFLGLRHGAVVEWIFFACSILIFLLGVLNFFRNRNVIERSKKHIGNYKIEYLNS